MSRTFDEAPNPCLWVDGTDSQSGNIGLPLSADSVELLLSAWPGRARPTRRTKNADALEASWVLDTEKVRLENPKWHRWLKGTVLPLVNSDLGVDQGKENKDVEYRMDKVALFGVGARYVHSLLHTVTFR